MLRRHLRKFLIVININKGIYTLKMKKLKCFVTGGAGFIGSHLVDKLMRYGCKVTVYDNLSLGKKEFIQHHFSNNKFKFIEADLLDFEMLKNSIKGNDVVFHLAANSNIIQSAKHTDIDLKQGTFATYNVLEAMRLNNIKKIVFSSSNVVYGEVNHFPIEENYGPLFPISFYGASKLACEGLITAYCHNFGFNSWIYRFVNIIGKRATHGIVVDFYRKLKKNPYELEVLGNGKQSKPYLEVYDCVDGILFGFDNSSEQINLFNLGTEGLTSVDNITQIILDEMGFKNVKLKYTGGIRGWPGDVHTVMLSTEKIKSLGWKPKYPTSDEAARIGVKEIIQDIRDK